MKGPERFIAIGIAAWCGFASASENTTAYGGETHAWMQRQTSAESKAPVRGLPGEAADRVYQRYLQSFARPIPEKFERDRAGNGDSQR